MRKTSWPFLFLSLALIFSCKGSGDSPTNTTCTGEQLTQLEQSMTSALSGASTDADFTLMLESADGRAYRYSRGTSTSTTSYESASTSKLVSAVVILSLVDRGFLSLESKPTDLIGGYWSPPAPVSAMTLRHLLSFTSGFYDEPLCINSGTFDFQTCVQNIYNQNIGYNKTPGSEFYYSSTHLQIAGLMAIKAHPIGSNTWNDIFNEFKLQTGLFSHSTYDLPSSSNPRLAGGMHWTGEDYLEFLRTLYKANCCPIT